MAGTAGAGGTAGTGGEDAGTTPAGATPGRGRRWALAGGGVAAVAAAGLVAAALTGGSPQASPPPDVVDLGPVQRVALQSFASCDALLAYYRGHAARLVGPYGLEGMAMPYAARATAAGAAEQSAADGSASLAAPVPAAKGADTGATSDTGTNVQVAGVDEADVAKLAGDLLVTLQGQSLQVTRVSGRTVTALGHVEVAPEERLPKSVTGQAEKLVPQTFAPFAPQQLLVHRAKAYVIGSLQSIVPDTAAIPDSDVRGSRFAPIMPMETRSRIAEVDLADPGRPRVARTLDVDGSVVGARLVDGVLRLAITSSPGRMTFRTPLTDAAGNVTEAANRRATQSNRKVVAAAGLDSWLPTYELTDRTGGTPRKVAGGRLVDCQDVASPKRFAGVGTLTLLTADLDAAGLAAHESTAVVARGATVYATADHTYVATGEWQSLAAVSKVAGGGGGGLETAIHLFTTGADGDRTASRYVASGSVRGHLLNQFAMDEHEGVLRVATTTEGEVVPATGGAAEDGDTATSSSGAGSSGSAGDAADDDAAGSQAVAPQPPQRPTESRVTTLRPRGRALAQVGVVSGLGRTEQIRSVRFIGDLGYVVTFRQTDPLYTVDLSDPARPRVAGELKILGYSAYLHPAGPGRLLGVGQDADSDGRVTGLQVSLFDITDPAAPKRIDAVGLGQAYSDVEGDHHAFTLADGLALSPYQRWWQPDPSSPYGMFDAGVLAVRVGGGSLQEPRTLRPVADGPVSEDGRVNPELEKVQTATPLRTFVRDGVVYTVTSRGIAVHDATTLSRIGFTTFPG
jgi:hypothetical protein